MRSAALAKLSDPGLVGAVALGFGVLVLLAVNGGGYDVVFRGQLAILLWWLLLLGVVAGLLPLRAPGWLALAAISMLALYVIWTGISLTWTESSERTLADLSRVAAYLGVFALAIALRSSRGVTRMVAAVGAGIVLVAGIALVSRLVPDLFPEAANTAASLPSEGYRLSYPLGYWNGLGALIAVGLPLVFHVAGSARSRVLRGLAAAALPLMALTLFLTFSRSGAGAAVIALLVLFAFGPGRLERLATLVVAGVGSALLIVVADRSEFVSEGPISVTGATGEGTELLLLAAGRMCGRRTAAGGAFDRVREVVEAPMGRAIEELHDPGAAVGRLATVIVVALVPSECRPKSTRPGPNSRHLEGLPRKARAGFRASAATTATSTGRRRSSRTRPGR